jgi:hypothetical protein
MAVRRVVRQVGLKNETLHLAGFVGFRFSTQPTNILNWGQTMNKDNELTEKLNNMLTESADEETETLDRLLAQVDELNILKTRARYSLNIFQNKQQLA